MVKNRLILKKLRREIIILGLIVSMIFIALFSLSMLILDMKQKQQELEDIRYEMSKQLTWLINLEGYRILENGDNFQLIDYCRKFNSLPEVCKNLGKNG